MSKLYLASIVCAVTPLIIGGAIYGLWVATDISWLMLAGVFNIYAGLALFIGGMICLSVYFYRERKLSKDGVLKKSAISLGLLLANFPAAIAALYGASYHLSESTLMVQNSTEYRITDIVLSERAVTYQFPVVEPNSSVTENFHFKYEGAVGYKFSVNGTEHEGLAFGYVTSHAGGKAKMVVSDDGKVVVERMKSNNGN